MNQLNTVGAFMDKIKSLGKKQHFVQMGTDYKSHYEVVGEL